MLPGGYESIIISYKIHENNLNHVKFIRVNVCDKSSVKVFLVKFKKALVVHSMPKVGNLKGLLTVKQQGGYSQAL